MEREFRVEVVIIGGGVLGVITAVLLAEAGHDVLLVRLIDDEHPRADSLNNHVWLQSGLLYLITRSHIAALLRGQGIRLLREFGMAEPVERGIFAFDTALELDDFLTKAEALGMRGLASPMLPATVLQSIGPLQVIDPSLTRSVPDTTFDEALLMEIARTRAEHDPHHPAAFGEVAQPVRLSKNNDRIHVHINGITIVPDVTVVAAGAGTNALLAPILEEALPLTVHRSPLLVVEGTFGVRTPLFVNCSTGLAVAMHKPSSDIPNGCLVIGNRQRTTIPASQVHDRRILGPGEIESIHRVLPPELLERILAAEPRYTAGHKTESNGNSVMPWTMPFEQYGLVVAVPGKATLSLWTSETQVVPAVESLLKTRAGLAHPSIPFIQPNRALEILLDHKARRWERRPKAHHTRRYRHMSDVN